MKKHQSKILIALSFLFIMFTTVAYAGLSTSLAITSEAVFRAMADIRVTDIKINNATGSALLQYESNYNVNSITSGFTLPDATSTISYTITITNNGNIDQVIYDMGMQSNNSGLVYLIDGKEISSPFEPIMVPLKTTKTITITYKTTTPSQNIINVINTFDFRKVYYITYDLQGGNSSSKDLLDGQIKYENVALTLTSDQPTKAGYTFINWSDEQTPKTTYLSGSEYVANSNVILYAQYNSNVYEIELDNGDATTIGTTKIYEKYDDSYYLDNALTKKMSTSSNGITKPEKIGYTFDGYYTDNTNYTTQFIDSNGKITSTASTTNFKAPGTLYAKWTKNTYTVKFASTTACPLNKSTYADVSATYDTTIINKANPTCTGYTFDGWTMTNGNSSTAKYGTTNDPQTAWVNKNKGTYFKNLASVLNTTVTLTANWKAKTYTLTVNPNSGIYNNKSENSTLTMTFDSKNNNSIGTAAKEGFTFIGWNTKADGTGVTIYDNQGKNTNESEYWSAAYSTGTWKYDNNLEIFAQYITNTYTISYDDQNGNIVTREVTYNGNYLLPPEPTRDGYTFAGWYTNTNYTDQITSSSIVEILEDQTLYAKWIANTYTVTANANGGSIPSTTGWTGTGNTSTKSVTFNQPYGILPEPTKTGYTFNGWYGKNLFKFKNVISGAYGFITRYDETTDIIHITGSVSDTRQYAFRFINSYTDNWNENIKFKIFEVDSQGADIKRIRLSDKWYDGNIAIDVILEKDKQYDLQFRIMAYLDDIPITYEPNYITSSSIVKTPSNHNIYAQYIPNELVFNGDDTLNKDFSTSAQAINITGASNGTGTYTYTEKSETNASSTATNYFSISGTTITIAANTPAGTYTYVVTATDSNSGATKDATYTITINRKKINLPTCGTFTYNRELQTLISSTTSYTASNNTRTNAGSQNVSLTPTSNYMWNDSTTTAKEVSCTINPYNITGTNSSVVPTPEKTYNGSEFEPTPAITVPLPSSTNTYTLTSNDINYTYENNINAGTATITITGKGNYTGSKTQNFIINKADGYLTLDKTSDNVTYGTSSVQFNVLTNSGNIEVSDNNSTATVSISGTTITVNNISTLTSGTSVVVTVTSKESDNYKQTTATYTLNITNKPLTGGAVKITGNNIVGNTLTAQITENTTPTATYNYTWYRVDSNGTETKVSGPNTTNTYVPTTNDLGYTIKVKVDATKENYDPTSFTDTTDVTNNKTIKTKTGVSKPTTAICNTNTYTGENLTLATIPTSDQLKYGLLNNTGIDAKSYTVTARLNDGYIWSNGDTTDVSISCSISKSNTTTTLSTITKTYNGNSQVVSGATSKLNSNNTNISNATITYNYYSGTSCSGTALSTAPKNAGTYRVQAILAGTNNYNTSNSDCVVYTMNKKEVPVTWSNIGPFTYDGTPKFPTASADTEITGETMTVSSTNATTVGTHTSTATCSSVTNGTCDNYTLTNTTQEFTINAQAVNPVTNLAVSTSGVVSWTASSNATGYQISTDGTNWTDMPSSQTSYNYFNVLTATSDNKTVYVRAINSDTNNYSTVDSGASYAHSSNATSSVTIRTLTIKSNNNNYGTVNNTSFYVINGATYSTSNNVLTLSDGRKSTATKIDAVGYTTTFSSWSSVSGTINANTTVTANFTRTANNYTVTANANGGSITSTTGWTGTGNTSIKGVTYDAAYGTLPTVSKEGYTFKGWSLIPDGFKQVEYIASTGTQYIDINTQIFNKENHEIVMDFEPTRFYNYNQLFGSTQDADTFESWVYSTGLFAARYSYIKYGSDNKINVNTRYLIDLIKEGTKLYKNVDNNSFGSATVSQSTSTATLTLFKSGSDYSEFKLYGAQIYSNHELVRNFVPCVNESTGKAGLYDLVSGTFFGNNATTGDDFTVPEEEYFIDSTSIVNIPSNHNIYAKWSPVNYSISYDLQGGTNSSSNPSNYNVESSNITLATPTRSGYTFTGWTGSNGTTAQTSVSIASGSTGDKSYTANWSKAMSALTITLSPTSYDYDGTAKTPTVTVKDGSTTLVEGTDYEIEYLNNINAGTATVKITSKGVYNSTTKSTYTGNTNKTFTINRVGISLPTCTTTYNKTEQTLLSTTTTYTVASSPLKGTNAGTYKVNVTPTSNYKWSSDNTTTAKEVSCVINQKELDQSKFTTSNTSKTYNGNTTSNITLTANTESGLISGDSVTVSYTSATYNNANVANATTITVSGMTLSNSNYKLKNTSQSYLGTITRANVAFPSCSSVTYNKAEQTLFAAHTSGGYTNSVLTATNAGTYTVALTPNANYKWTDTSGTTARDLSCTINKYNISSATVSTIPDHTYDNTAYKPTPSVTVPLPTSTNTYTLTDSEYTYSYSATDPKDVNTYTVTMTAKADTSTFTNNYIGSVSKTYMIVQANGYVNLSATTGSVTYGTSSVTFTVDSSHGGTLSVNDDNATATSSITNGTVTIGNLGSLTSGTKVKVTVTSAATTNYKAASATYELTISNAAITCGTVTISGYNTVGDTLTANVTGTSPSDATKSYQWYTNTSDSVTGGSPIATATSSTFTLTSSQAGKYIYVVVTCSKENYTSNSSSQKTSTASNTTAITKTKVAKPTASGYCANPTYNGSSQVITKTAATGYSFTNNSATTYINPTPVSGKAETVYEVTANLSNNYIWSDYSTGSVKIDCGINRKQVTYTADSDEKVYDGTPLTKQSATLTSGTLVSGHSASFSISGTQTNAGSSTNTLNSVTIKNGTVDVTSNYNITTANGTLTVNKADAICIINSTPTLTYPGNTTGNITYSCTGDGTLNVTSSDTSVITVGTKGTSSTPLTAKKLGSSTISVSRAAGTNYNAATAAQSTVNVTGTIYAINLSPEFNNETSDGGTEIIYEKYGTGYYKNSAATTQMTTSSNAITIPTREGYTFLGYFTTVSGGTKYIDENGKLTSSASNTNFTSEGTLYAHWGKSVGELTITASPAGKIYTGNALTYTILKLEDGETTLTANTDYSVAYTNNIEISYTNADKATATITGKNVYNSTTKAFYTGTTTKTFFINNATVTFDENTGTLSGTGTLFVKKGEKVFYTGIRNTTVGDIPTASKSGYTFNGWYTASTAGSQLIDANGNIKSGVSGWTDANGNFLKTSVSTLYAQYTYIATPTITLSDYNTFTYDATSGSKFLVTTSSEVPTTSTSGWTTTKTTGNLTLSEGTTYYVWVQDASGNISTNKATIAVRTITRSVGTGSTLTAKYTSSSGSDITFTSNKANVLNGTVVYMSAGLSTGYKNAVLKKDGTNTTNSTTYTIEANTTFATSATANTYTLTANANGGTISTTSGWTGSGNTATKTVTYNSTYGTLPTISREGYTFDGWYTDTNYTTQVTSSTTYTNLSSSTIYAKWTAKTYTINYYQGKAEDTVGNNKSTKTTTCTFGQVCNLESYSSLGFTLPNTTWAFEGFNSSQTVADPSIKTSINPTTYSSTIDLYVVLSKTFDFYSGQAPTSIMTSQTQYWIPYSNSDTYLTSITIPTPIDIDGWNFVGYRCGSNAANSSVTFAASTIGTSVKPDIALFPGTRSVYNRQLTIDYDSNGGSGSVSSNAKTQYYSSGYGKNNENVGETITSLSFTLKANAFTKTGYTFSKWAEDSVNGTQYDESSNYVFAPLVGESNTKTMYALWTANNYSISYTMNGGNDPTSKPTSATYDEDVQITNPTKTFTVNIDANSQDASITNTSGTAVTSASSSQTFKGWTSTTVGSNATSGTSAKPTTSWTGTSTKNTHFMNLNESGTVTMIANWTAVNVTLPNISKIGYTCKYNTKANGSGTNYTSGASYTPSTTTNSATLFAICTEDTYTITYELNGGTNSSNNPSTYTVNSNDITLEPLTRSGYTFNGWSSNNLFDKNATPTSTSTYINGAGTETSHPEYSIYQVNIEANKSYTIVNSGGSSTPGYAIYNSNGTRLAGANYAGNEVITFTSPANSSYIKFSVVTKSDSNRYDKNIFELYETNNLISTYDTYVTKTIPTGSVGNKTFTANWTYTTTPTITLSDYNTFTYDATSGSKFLVTTSSEVPTTSTSGWTTTKTTGNLTLSEGTTYYVWVQDASGNISTNKATIAVRTITRSVGTGSTLTAKYTSSSGSDITFTSNKANVLNGTVVYMSAGLSTGYKNAVLKKDGTNTTNSTTYTIEANTTFATSATANTYTLTANANGGTIPTTSGWTGSGNTATKTVTYNSTYGTLPTPTRTGYTFKGWFTGISDGTQVADSTTYTTAGISTIYARWADETAPVATITGGTTAKKTSQTFNLSCTDDVGVTAYYWGTKSSPADSDFTTIDSTTNLSTTGTANSAATYYLVCKDNGTGSTNTGATTSKVVRSYVVHNMLQNINGTSGYSTANYTLSASATTYYVVSGTSLTSANVCTTPTGADALLGYNLAAPSATAATLTESSTNIAMSANRTVSCWYDRKTYTVTVNSGANGSTTAQTVTQTSNSTTATSGTSSTLTVRYGDKVTATATPSTGYTFDGWSGGYVSASTTPVTGAAITANKTITSSFVGGIFKITFDNQDATTSGTTEAYYQYKTVNKDSQNRDAIYFEDSALTTPINDGVLNTSGYNGIYITLPTKAGYTFDGYFSGENGTGTRYWRADGSSTNSLYTRSSSNITIYAHWIANTYTVTYYQGNLEEGETTLGTTECTYGETCALTSYSELGGTAPTTSWSFAGWSNDSDQTDLTRDYTNSKSFTYNLTSDLNLHAVFSRNVYFAGGYEPSAYIQVNGSVAQVQYFRPYSDADDYISEITVPNFPEDSTLTSGVWIPIGYSGTNAADHGRVLISSTAAGTQQKLGYSQSRYLRAKYARQVSIDYNANGGSGTNSSQYAYQYYNSGIATGGSTLGSVTISLIDSIDNNYTYAGYTFNKWAEGSASGTQYDLGSTYTFTPAIDTANPSQTFYATWTPNVYKIIFDSNGATTSGTTEAYYIYKTVNTINNVSCYYYSDESTTTCLDDGVVITLPTKINSTFNGYYSALSGGTRFWQATGRSTNSLYNRLPSSINSNYSNENLSEITLYARWTNPTYTLTYQLDGGSLGSGVTNPSSYTYDSDEITLNNPTKSGSSFNGWTETVSNFTWSDGFINQTTGVVETNSTYPNAHYTEMIYLKQGVTYTLSGYGSYASSRIRWRIYNLDGSYFGGKSNNETWTATKDCYARIMFYYGTPTEAQMSGTIMTSSDVSGNVIIPTHSTGNRTYTANYSSNPTKPTAENYCKSGLIYNGSVQTVTKAPGEGYTFSNNTGTNAGTYTVTATLDSGGTWSDGTSTSITFDCSIGKAKPKIGFETDNLIYGMNDTQYDIYSIRQSYSIYNNSITVTATAHDGFGYSTARVYLMKGHKYNFSTTVSATWGSFGRSSDLDSSIGTDTVEIYLINVDNNSKIIHILNPTQEIEPPATGVYKIRFDVNKKGKTYVFKDVSIVEQIDNLTSSLQSISAEYGSSSNFYYTSDVNGKFSLDGYTKMACNTGQIIYNTTLNKKGYYSFNTTSSKCAVTTSTPAVSGNILFTPTDTVNYESVTKKINVNINKSIPKVTMTSIADDIAAQTSLGKNLVVTYNPSVNVDGTWSFSTAGTYEDFCNQLGTGTSLYRNAGEIGKYYVQCDYAKAFDNNDLTNMIMVNGTFTPSDTGYESIDMGYRIGSILTKNLVIYYSIGGNIGGNSSESDTPITGLSSVPVSGSHTTRFIKSDSMFYPKINSICTFTQPNDSNISITFPSDLNVMATYTEKNLKNYVVGTFTPDTYYPITIHVASSITSQKDIDIICEPSDSSKLLEY